MKDIKEVLKYPEYQWINEEPRLKNRIAFLTFGGSISYGLDTPESDIDIRGVCMPTIEDLFGCGFLINKDEMKNNRLVFGKEGFEQVTDTPTDTTIYVLKKIISLLYKCNPNVIEMLGCKPEHYAYVSPFGQRLIDNKELFLSKLAYGSFAGYARAQFQRLKNAIGKDSQSNVFQSINLADSINRMHGHLEREYPEYNRDMLKIYVTDNSGNDIKVNGTPVSAYDVGIMFNDVITEITSNGVPITDEDVQIRFSVNFDRIPNRAFLGIFNEVAGAVKDFNKHLGHRNHKKDNYHLNKHAMHLIRLYLMALDILNDHEIITYREKDHDFLMSIKAGEYFNEQTNTFNTKFFDIVTEFDKKILNAYENTTLPDYPDIDKINKLVMNINQDYLYMIKATESMNNFYSNLNDIQEGGLMCNQHRHRQKHRPKIKNVLIVYNDPNQKLSEVEDSVRKYFYYPDIKILNFLNINDLTEDKARELMPIIGNCTDFFGNIHHYYYLHYDAVVMCAEQKRLRQQMAKTFDLVDYFSRTHYIRYSTIRHTLNCRKGLF